MCGLVASTTLDPVQHHAPAPWALAERRKPDHTACRPGYLRTRYRASGRHLHPHGAPPYQAPSFAVTQWQTVGCCQIDLGIAFDPGFRGHAASVPFPQVEGYYIPTTAIVSSLRLRRVEKFALNKLLSVCRSSPSQRAHRTTDNAFESRGKNGAVAAQTHRTRTDRSRACREFSVSTVAEFNPYLNYGIALDRIRHRGGETGRASGGAATGSETTARPTRSVAFARVEWELST